MFLQILEKFAETQFLKDRIKRLSAILITEKLLLETAAVISKDICEDKIHVSVFYLAEFQLPVRC